MEITENLTSGVLEIDSVRFFMMGEKFIYEAVFCVELGNFRLFGEDFHFLLVCKFIVALTFSVI